MNPMILNWNESSVSRRRFLKQTAAVTVGVACGTGPSDAATPKRPDEPFLQTVLGPVPIAEFGPALIHEHVMCDFIGAEQTGRHRWDVDAVVKRMAPYLKQLKERAVTGFVDCTPAFIGRDPRVLKRLAEETQDTTAVRATNLSRSTPTTKARPNSVLAGCVNGRRASRTPVCARVL